MKFAHALIIAIFVAIPALAADLPSPESHLGYRPGADFKLAKWSQVVDYFKKIDAASDRVVVQELGTSTEGRPYIVAVVSSPETIKDLEKYKAWQHKVADPRLPESDEALKLSKPVVLITCSIHSVETASTLTAIELLYDLAKGTDPRTFEILENTIFLLVPSANPDGVDKIADWYDASRGKPWEGEGMPWLYHKYAGHDTNRDWFMGNLKETQLLTKMLYFEWFPTITYDIHQMGMKGARMFVPPFYDPVNPNLDARLSQSIALIGSHMAADLASSGRKGVLTHAMYDNWWNGGNRTTPQRHNMVGLLSESASVRMASPVFIAPGDLGGATRGFPNHRKSVNFVDPWPGGWWRLRDIVADQLVCSKSVLTLAARYRVMFQTNYQAMAREAIERGLREAPFAWIVPTDQVDLGTAHEMISVLRKTGIEVEVATAPINTGSEIFPAGSFVLRASQPYRAHLKDMMERQVYPPRFGADGSAEPPYDVAGWTLPLQMGVKAVTLNAPFEAKTQPFSDQTHPVGRLTGPETSKRFAFDHAGNDAFVLINALQKAGVETLLKTENGKPDRVQIAATPANKALLEKLLPSVALIVQGEVAVPDGMKLPVKRLALYQPWTSNMDEGWTRLVLERFGFGYTTLHNAEIKAGKLIEKFDVLILPSATARSITSGQPSGQTAPAYAGGLGTSGAEAIRAFVRAGGTVVGLENSSSYLIATLELPVTNLLAGQKTSVFYGPGSILAGTTEGETALTSGVPKNVSLYFANSLAFDIQKPKSGTQIGDPVTVLRYASSEPLQSGWLLGGEKLQGKAAMITVPVGKGRAVLFAFPPQHRGQPHGTFRLLFNAISR
jgi:hypothetical protein